MTLRPMTYAYPGQIAGLIRETRARYETGTPPHRIAHWLAERLARIRAPRQWCPVDTAGWLRLEDQVAAMSQMLDVARHDPH